MTAIQTVRFCLPLPPSRGNRRGYWRPHWRREADWQLRAQVSMRSRGIGWPAQPWARTRIQMHFYLPRREDPDNVDSRRKIVLDFLKEHWAGPTKAGVQQLSRPPDPDDWRAVRVKPGFFRDDSAEYIELLPSTQEFHPKRDEVLVTLERLS